jgi:hypothetical protein
MVRVGTSVLAGKNGAQSPDGRGRAWWRKGWRIASALVGLSAWRVCCAGPFDHGVPHIEEPVRLTIDSIGEGIYARACHTMARRTVFLRD